MSIEHGRRVLQIEGEAILALVGRVGEAFTKAVDLLAGCRGKIVVTGMGKSGLIGQKIAATFSSTGAPAFFLHPAEGLHGDVGMLSRGDVVLAISTSGETRELMQLLLLLKRFGLPLLCLTGHPASTLARAADLVLDCSVKEEACPLNLAPTASTTATLAMGDALAIALFQRRGLKAEDFALLHPGGTLGQQLRRVEELMRQGIEIPIVREETPMTETVIEMSAKKLGMTVVVDAERRLVGIITDGDLRRGLQRSGERFFHERAGAVMTKHPKLIRRDLLAAQALRVMEQHAITALVVADDHGRVAGILHLHDLLRQGVV